MSSLAPREPLTEQLARHVGDKIISGMYLPGQKLREMEIAQEMDVSSNTVREAFHILQKRHLVVIEPRRGAFVSDITPQQVADLYDFLFLLFAEVTARAADNWNEQDLADFTALLVRLGEQMQAGDGAAFHATAFEFVHAAMRFTDNRYLLDAVTDLLPQLQRCSYIALRAETSEIDTSYALFQLLVEKMIQRDAAAAAKAAKAYGENQARIVLKALRA